MKARRPAIAPGHKCGEGRGSETAPALIWAQLRSPTTFCSDVCSREEGQSGRSERP